MAEFSMELNEDQKTVQSWVHDFAENVMRPAAHEWDEREETPWPIIEEAAKVGLYSMDFMADAFSDPQGLKMVIALEELAWGDAGICLALMGTTLAVAGIMANGTPEQAMEWIPQCFGTPDDLKLAAFGVSEPDAGSDVSSLKTRAVYDKATDEWVLNGTKTWITNGGIANTHVIVASVDPELRGRGQASFIVPEGTKGISMGQKFQKMGIRASHTAEVVLDDCRIPGSMLLGGKDKLDEKLARARGNSPVGWRAGTRDCPCGLRVLARVRQGAPAVRPSHHREPGDRVQARQYEDPDRCSPPAGLACRMDGRHWRAFREWRGLDVQVVRV